MRLTLIWLSLLLWLFFFFLAFCLFVWLLGVACLVRGVLFSNEVLALAVSGLSSLIGLCWEGPAPSSSSPLSLSSSISSSSKPRTWLTSTITQIILTWHYQVIFSLFSSLNSALNSCLGPYLIVIVWHTVGTQEILNESINTEWLYMGESCSSQVKRQLPKLASTPPFYFAPLGHC